MADKLTLSYIQNSSEYRLAERGRGVAAARARATAVSCQLCAHRRQLSSAPQLGAAHIILSSPRAPADSRYGQRPQQQQAVRRHIARQAKAKPGAWKPEAKRHAISQCAAPPWRTTRHAQAPNATCTCPHAHMRMSKHAMPRGLEDRAPLPTCMHAYAKERRTAYVHGHEPLVSSASKSTRCLPFLLRPIAQHGEERSKRMVPSTNPNVPFQCKFCMRRPTRLAPDPAATRQQV